MKLQQEIACHANKARAKLQEMKSSIPPCGIENIIDPNSLKANPKGRFHLWYYPKGSTSWARLRCATAAVALSSYNKLKEVGAVKNLTVANTHRTMAFPYASNDFWPKYLATKGY